MHILVGAGRAQGLVKPPAEPQRPPFPAPPSGATSLPPCWCVLSRFSCVRFCATPWTAACQAPLSMGFSRQEYWSGLPCPSPGDLPDPGIKPMSLTSPAVASGFVRTSTTWHTLQFLQKPSKSELKSGRTGWVGVQWPESEPQSSCEGPFSDPKSGSELPHIILPSYPFLSKLN